MRKAWVLVVCVLLATTLGFASPFTLNNGDSITQTFTNGTEGASATFSLSGSTLTIVLTNTGAAASVPTDVLTALMWSSSQTLTPVSAMLTSGSSLVNTTTTLATSGDVGNGWQYMSGFSGPSSTTQGVGAAGLGLFGPSSNFCSTAGCTNQLVGGLDYGIVNGFNNPNGGITNNAPYENNSVTFALGVTGGSITLDNLFFQYGTAIGETSVPEPASLTLLGLGLLGVGWKSRRRKKA